MIICKSNFLELADNLRFSVGHDVGLNLSPVLLYPVSEQLNVFEDFETETAGWDIVLADARQVVADAKANSKRAISRVDPSGMVDELTRIYEETKARYRAVEVVKVSVTDHHDSLVNMARPAIIAHIGGTACAYCRIMPGRKDYILRIPRLLLGQPEQDLRIDFVHDVMEPHGILMLFASPPYEFPKKLQFIAPRFKRTERGKNINWATYGDTTPDGVFVRDPTEITAAYRERFKEEVLWQNGQVTGARRSYTVSIEPSSDAGRAWHRRLRATSLLSRLARLATYRG